MNANELKRIDRLPGWLSLHEGLFLHKAALHVRSLPGSLVEIGSYQGKSTIYLAKTKQPIYAIDPHEGKLDTGTQMPPTLRAFQDHIKKFRVESFVTLIKGKSHSAVKKWAGPIKLLFIDGLHDEMNARLDYEDWSPFVVDGGIIAMHDSFCGWEGAQEVALKHIVFNDDFREVGVVGSIIYGIKGKTDIFSFLNRARIRALVPLAFWIHKTRPLPQAFSFFIIHRLIKLCMINHFTFRRV